MTYPRVIAHRCGGALAPENTLAGGDIAARLGCAGVEFDVMLSAEGSPWLIHDETLERTTNGVGRVCDTPDALLASLDAGCKHHRAYTGTPLPTFAAALAQCQQHGFFTNVEIKPATGYEAVTGTVVANEIVRRWPATCALVVSSFAEESLIAARLAAPHLPFAWLVDEIPADWQARCAALGVMAIHTNSRYLDRATTQAVRAAGLQLAVYTENDPLRARELLEWGVACIITDRPDIVTA